MSETKHCYRGDAALFNALEALVELRREFKRTVIDVHAETSGKPDVVWLEYETELDPRAVGFVDDGAEEVPAGLSRARNRNYLKPTKSKAGQEWQAILDRMNKRPKLAEVLERHGIKTWIFHGDRVCTPGMLVDEETRTPYLICTAPLESEHLTEIKMSEFYAAREACEERQQAKA